MLDVKDKAAAPGRAPRLPARKAGAGGRGGAKAIRRLKNGVWYELRAAANGTWYVHWSEQRRSKRESTREKELVPALAYFDEWLNLLDAPGRGQSLTCADLWLAKYDETTERTRYVWANLAPTFGALLPIEVTQAKVDGYIRDRRAGRIGKTKARPSTIRLELASLYASWNAAVKGRVLSSADLPVLAPPPPPSPPRERWLDDTEIAAMMTTAQAMRQGQRLSRGERFLWLALDACARRTAIQELLWEQVDLEQRIIDFNPAGRAQTRKRRASVPISDRLYVVLLRAHRERTGPHVLDRPTRINPEIERIARNAGVPGVHPHVLRHTAATHMARRGVSLWTIAKLLGNTIDQVEKVYSKWQPGFGREAVEMIGGGPGLRLVDGRDSGTSAQEGRQTRPAATNTDL